jgi:acylphosphatase
MSSLAKLTNVLFRYVIAARDEPMDGVKGIVNGVPDGTVSGVVRGDGSALATEAECNLGWPTPTDEGT